MAATLVILDSNGMPLLSRSHGAPALSFPTMGLLSALFSTSESVGAPLLALRSADVQVVLRSFRDTLLLVLVTSRTGPRRTHEALLDLLFAALVLVVGERVVTRAGNVELLKRQLRTCTPLLDALLNEDAPAAVLAGAPLVRPPPRDSALPSVLAAFASRAGASHACLLADGAVVAATDDYWALDACEHVLVAALIGAMPPASAQDVPVFLPVLSPSVPYRCLAVAIPGGLTGVVLCGPEPDLAAVYASVDEFFGPVRAQVEAGPINLGLHDGVAGLLAVATGSRRMVVEHLCERCSPGGLRAKDGTRVRRLLRAMVQATRLAQDPTERQRDGFTRFDHERDAVTGAFGSGADFALASVVSDPDIELHLCFFGHVAAYERDPLAAETLARLKSIIYPLGL